MDEGIFIKTGGNGICRSPRKFPTPRCPHHAVGEEIFIKKGGLDIPVAPRTNAVTVGPKTRSVTALRYPRHAVDQEIFIKTGAEIDA